MTASENRVGVALLSDNSILLVFLPADESKAIFVTSLEREEARYLWKELGLALDRCE